MFLWALIPCYVRWKELSGGFGLGSTWLVGKWEENRDHLCFLNADLQLLFNMNFFWLFPHLSLITISTCMYSSSYLCVRNGSPLKWIVF